MKLTDVVGWGSGGDVKFNRKSTHDKRYLRWVYDLHVAVLVQSLQFLWGRIYERVVVAELEEALQPPA